MSERHVRTEKYFRITGYIFMLIFLAFFASVLISPDGLGLSLSEVYFTAALLLIPVGICHHNQKPKEKQNEI